MDAEKVKQEKAQRKADEALMEPARLAARGLTLEQIETDMKRSGIKMERSYIQRQIEKADRKRAAEEDEPFYAVNTQVRAQGSVAIALHGYQPYTWQCKYNQAIGLHGELEAITMVAWLLAICMAM